MTDEAQASSQIADFFAGKNVFLTGGTGFLGKVHFENFI
jgi:hypothetical protein